MRIHINDAGHDIEERFISAARLARLAGYAADADPVIVLRTRGGLTARIGCNDQVRLQPGLRVTVEPSPPGATRRF